jgi:hypothetical protein
VITRFQEKDALIEVIGINDASKKIIHKYNSSKIDHILLSFQGSKN